MKNINIIEPLNNDVNGIMLYFRLTEFLKERNITISCNIDDYFTSHIILIWTDLVNNKYSKDCLLKIEKYAFNKNIIIIFENKIDNINPILGYKLIKNDEMIIENLLNNL